MAGEKWGGSGRDMRRKALREEEGWEEGGWLGR